VIKYLGRYTHRIGISNRRIVSAAEDRVTFRYRDYRHGNVVRTMSLSGLEFIRRFLLHVLPDGFMRIRHYGFLANRVRKEKLAQCRAALHVDPPREEEAMEDTSWHAVVQRLTGKDPLLCPCCRKGRLSVCKEIPASGGQAAVSRAA